MKKLAVTLITIALAGCGAVPREIVEKSPDTEICEAIGIFNRPMYATQLQPYWEEALKRKLFNEQEINTIPTRRIFIGMRQCALYATWGKPPRENRSVGSWGVNIQHVYGSSYVYTRNGVVTSYQN